MRDDALAALKVMDIDVWRPCESQAALQPKQTDQVTPLIWHYQAQTQTDLLVLIDQEAINVWPEARKLLANIMYFVGLRPGQYHIAKCLDPAVKPRGDVKDNSREDVLLDWQDLSINNKLRIISFGVGCQFAASYKISYVETSSLADILTNPLLKKQVLHDLSTNKIS